MFCSEECLGKYKEARDKADHGYVYWLKMFSVRRFVTEDICEWCGKKIEKPVPFHY
jgi:hypothetical protein